jgi:predicted esterase
MSNAASTLDGPLIFSWYGMGGTPQLALEVFSDEEIAAITALGGIIACPYHDDPGSGPYPWYLTYPDGKEDDLRVADEVLACAIQKVGVDTRRIHSIGFSSGGLHTTQMSFRRSGYIASVVVMSGGLNGAVPSDPAPMNPFAAMIFYGGPSDSVGQTSFEALSKNYRAVLTARGSFTVLCNHNGGHSPPSEQTMWPFFEAHSYGRRPQPWADGLPAGQPSYCKR